MNAMKILLVLPIFITTACHTKKAVADNPADLTGIWVLQDTNKMTAYLGKKIESPMYYCIDFQPTAGTASIKFNSKDVATQVSVKKMEDGSFQISRDGKIRSFSINKDQSRDIYYWHFNGSSPYDPGNLGAYDGTKEKYTSMDDCIKDLEAENAQTPVDGKGVFEPLSKTKK